MRELTMNEVSQVDGGISSNTVKAGARLLGRTLLAGVAIGSGAGVILSVGLILADVLID